ncbi:MAG: tetratricopeptide repeat protein [Acidobacteriota bacterium]
MSETERWQRLDKLFHRAWDLPPEDRKSFLQAECGDDSLRAEVESLLAAAESPSGWIDGTASDEAFQVLATDQIFPSGTRIGRYRIVRPLGHGGMGSVYLAERGDGYFNQQVALKVIKRGMDTESILERFRRERQILAQLDHPSIARLIDGGATRDGRPYLVMEYVEGEPIDRYAESNQLTIDQRLDLFLRICDAVRYSHSNLVIHRDLKPSNILVTPFGTPKLLDFGTAKLLERVDSEQTAHELRLMTPGYASPEQIEGRPVTTAADVFGLGVLLYELLTGAHPFRHKSASRQQVAAAVRELEPARPSVAAAPERKLRLTGDLDAIVLCALRKDIAERYDSVAALSEDLERHRSLQPVRARQRSLRYSASRFLRRNVYAMAAAFIAAVSILAFGILLLTEQRQTQREKVRAEIITDYLKGMFEGFDPLHGVPAPVTARRMLDRGVERLEQDFQGQERLKAEVLTVLGEIYGNLGHVAESRDLFLRALEIESRMPGKRTRQRAQLLALVADARIEAGDLETASRDLEASRQLLGDSGAGDRIELAKVGLLQGRIERLRGRNQRAERLLVDSLETLRSAPESESEVLEDALIELGTLRRIQVRMEPAQALLREAVERRSQRYGDDHPQTVIASEALAAVWFETGEIERARDLMLRVFEAHQRNLGEDHPLVIASYYNLGAVAATLGDYRQAEANLAEALRRMRASSGDDHPHLGSALMWAARVALDRGRLGTARELAAESLERVSRLYPENHSIIMDGWHLIGHVERASGDLEASRQAFERAMGLAPNSYTGALSRLFQAEVALDLGQLDRASQLIAEIPPRPKKNDVRRAIRRASIEAALALRRGDLDLASSLLEQAPVGKIETLMLPDRLRYQNVEVALDLARRRPHQAEEKARQSLALALETIGPQSLHAGQAELGLGLALIDQGRDREATLHLQRAIEVLPPTIDRPPHGHPSARTALRQSQSSH